MGLAMGIVGDAEGGGANIGYLPTYPPTYPWVLCKVSKFVCQSITSTHADTERARYANTDTDTSAPIPMRIRGCSGLIVYSHAKLLLT